MGIRRTIIIAVSLVAVIPLLVIVYLFSHGSSYVFTARAAIVAITSFIGILGLFGLFRLAAEISKLYAGLSAIAQGNVTHKVTPDVPSGTAELAASINEISQKLLFSLDELERRAILIERSNREYKRVNELKSKYLSDTVHELRAPLINIEKSSGMLIQRNAPLLHPDDADLLRIINTNALRLSRMTNDLLDRSKLEAGALTVRLETVPVKEIVSAGIEAVDSWRKSRTISLEVSVPDNIPRVIADKDRTIQVVVNLLSNAIKFTPAGGTISVRAASFGQSAGFDTSGRRFIAVSVSDTGPGIAQQRMQEIFERFKSGSESEAAGISNTGLGLPIAKHIVELQGGRLWAESDGHRGSTFTFIIPEAARQSSVILSGDRPANTITTREG